MTSSRLQTIEWKALRRVHQLDGELHRFALKAAPDAFCIAETQAIAGRPFLVSGIIAALPARCDDDNAGRVREAGRDQRAGLPARRRE